MIVAGKVPRVLKYLTLTFLAVIWISPLLMMFIYSFAPNRDIILMRLLPTRFILDNYVIAITQRIQGVSLPSSIRVSLVVVILQVGGILILDAPAGYALARFQFRLREPIFVMILVTMMMPGHIILISLYEMMSTFGMVDTLPGIVLPGLPRVVGIFLLRQFFRQLPGELDDAATIDGANSWQVFTRVMIPMATPAFATLTVLTVLYSWNNFLWPLVIVSSARLMTVPIAVAYIHSGTNVIQNFATLLAAAFLTSLPMILFFLVAQKQIVAGVAPTSGLKQ